MSDERHRVRAEFDIVIPEGRLADATTWAERAWAAMAKAHLDEGAEATTSGGSPDVVVRTLLDDPAQRSTMLAATLLTLGQVVTEGAVQVRSFRIVPAPDQPPS